MILWLLLLLAAVAVAAGFAMSIGAVMLGLLAATLTLRMLARVSRPR